LGHESHGGFGTRVGQAVDRVESCPPELLRDERSRCWSGYVAGERGCGPRYQYLPQLKGGCALPELSELLVLLLGYCDSLVVQGRLHFLDARQCISHYIVCARDVAEICCELTYVV
jgi:hypothetical protein